MAPWDIYMTNLGVNPLRREIEHNKQVVHTDREAYSAIDKETSSSRDQKISKRLMDIYLLMSSETVTS